MGIMVFNKLPPIRYNFLIAFILILLVNFGVSDVSGSEIKLTPKISIQETYNDNIDFTSKNEIDDFITVFTPSLNFVRDTEKSHIKFNASAGIEDYQDENNLDDVIHYYDLTSGYNLSSLIMIDFFSSFRRDTTLDEELETTGLILERSDRESYRIQPGITWNITEVDSLGFNFNFTKTRYDRESYTDYDNYDGTISWNHLISPTGTTYFISAGYNLTDYNDADVETYSLYSGFNLPLDPEWELNCWGGIRRTINKYDTYLLMPYPEPPFFYFARDDKTRRDWGGIGLFLIKRSFEKGSLLAEISRNIIPSGSGGTLERDRARLNISYRITDILTARLGGSWTDSQSESSNWNSDEEYYSFNSSLTYRLGEKITATLSYTRSEKDYKNRSSDTKADRNVVFIKITSYWEKLLK